MFTLKIKNANGETFELTHNSENYLITDIQGLTRPQAAINTSTGGALDGTFFNSSRVEQRNLVITVELHGDIEANRQQLYSICSINKPCTIFFKNKNRDVQIIGYVETLEGDLFTSDEKMQISIICPRPYFEDLNAIYTELSETVRLFEFPFSIEESAPIPFSEIVDYPLCTVKNSGDVECGCKMAVEVIGSVTGLTIHNSTTQKFFGLNYSFTAGDTITIDTISGEMGVSLLRSGVVTNLLNYVTEGSTWIKLALGDNDFTFTTTTGDDAVRVTFVSTNLYGRV